MKCNDAVISATVAKVLAETHPDMTRGQRQRVIASVTAAAGASRDNPAFAGVWSNVELVAMDVAAAIRRDPSLVVSVPDVNTLLAREVAAGSIKPEDRLTRLRQLQAMDDDERLAAQAALPARKDDDARKDEGAAATPAETRKLAENSDAALLERARQEVMKTRGTDTPSGVDVRAAFNVLKTRRDRALAERAALDAEHAIRGDKGMSAADRLTRHRLAQAGK